MSSLSITVPYPGRDEGGARDGLGRLWARGRLHDGRITPLFGVGRRARVEARRPHRVGKRLIASSLLTGRKDVKDSHTPQAIDTITCGPQAHHAQGHSAGELLRGPVSWFPFYYGWVIVVAATMGQILTSPGQTYAISIFIEEFITDLEISRTLVSTLYTLGTLFASLALPFVGRQIDRRGPRAVAVLVTLLFGLACVYMGSVRTAWMLGIGFFLVRLLGQGSLSMVSSNVMNRWWVRRRGAVLGIAGVAASVLGLGTFPSIIHALIGRFGWRTSYPLLGLVVMAVMLPVALVFYRRQPEDYGLQPDGGLGSGGAQPRMVAEGGHHTGIVEENWTSREAVGTTAFWLISMGVATGSMLSTGLHFHMVSIFSDSGLASGIAAAAYLPVAATVAVVRLVAGFLADRIPARVLLCFALVGQAVSLILAPNLSTQWMAMLYGVVLGISNGLQMTVSSVVWANYFGRRHLGAITGIASFIGIAGSALGPMPMGIARDLLGSYAVALPVSASLPAVLAVAVLFVRRPQRASISPATG